eukprot:TRINITY_DN576_c0_g1_i7.p1 TRINITY_DN576_c0_g1~~TRINITY_DN576_c0_g1_i7.p1  ORF type:complete len:395 (-),score=65.37 TRINITY_DN576_c0_g1_i7:208-1392(-)
MGCASSSTAKAERRRLSAVHCEGDCTTCSNGQREDYRTNTLFRDFLDSSGVIDQLTEQTIIDMIDHMDHGPGASPADGGCRRRSIASKTDKGTMCFANKSVTQAGDDADFAGIGFTCRKGLKPDSQNQDSWFVLQTEAFSIYAVFDGHGVKGHDVSNFAKDVLPKLFFKEWRNGKTQDVGACLTSAFKGTQQLIVHSDKMRHFDAQMSGTTATVAIHDHHEHTVTVGHVGDSTCVLAEKMVDHCENVLVTRAHKPNLEDEKARIEAAGGHVQFDGCENWRVYKKNARYPGINMSRSLGDLVGHKCGMSCEPEISKVKITPGKEHLLLVCSDGVWDFFQPQEALGCVNSFPPAKAQDAADTLAQEAFNRWIQEEFGSDDITVVLAHLGKDNIMND